jgi:hypothetical protein
MLGCDVQTPIYTVRGTTYYLRNNEASETHVGISRLAYALVLKGYEELLSDMSIRVYYQKGNRRVAVTDCLRYKQSYVWFTKIDDINIMSFNAISDWLRINKRKARDKVLRVDDYRKAIKEYVKRITRTGKWRHLEEGNYALLLTKEGKDAITGEEFVARDIKDYVHLRKGVRFFKRRDYNGAEN